jgi:hypothetical protein
MVEKNVLIYILKFNYKNQKWLHTNFFTLFDVQDISMVDFDQTVKINIAKDQINQYKIINTNNHFVAKDIINNLQIKRNLDIFISSILPHIDSNGREIRLEDCIVVDLLQGRGVFPSLHTDREWGIFDESDGFQVWYLYKNREDYGNMVICLYWIHLR